MIHVNHGIRGKEADEDQEFVKSLSLLYNLPLYSKKVDASAYAEIKKLSIEESARTLRYEFFEDMLAQTQSNKLATGHTANDLAETVIDHFLRGSGSLGLKGIPQKRGPYIRPLLQFGREELQEFAHKNELTYREDSSNLDLSLKRNRIRNELIPYIARNFNKNIIKTLSRTSEIFQETETFLKACASDAFKSLVSLQKKNEIILEIDGFLSYNTVVQKYILFHCCEQLSINRNQLNFNKLEKLLGLINRGEIAKKFVINSEFELQIDHDGIVFKSLEREPLPRVEIDLLNEKSLQYRNYEFRWSVLTNDRNIKFSKNQRIEFFDFEKTGSKLSLKGLCPGDKFIPLNSKGTKKVADFFSDHKVPLHLRPEIPILESSNGILWICGYRIDNRFKVTQDTRKVLRVEMKESADE